MAANLKTRGTAFPRYLTPTTPLRNIQGCFPTMVEGLYATLPSVRLEVPANSILDSWSEAQAVRERNAHASAVKAERLKQFKDEVRRRVHMLEQIKKQQILEHSFKALELERSIVRKTAFAAEAAVPREAGCIMQDNLDLVIGKGSCSKSEGSAQCLLQESKKTDHRNALHHEHRRRLNARKKLAAMKIISDTGAQSYWKIKSGSPTVPEGTCEHVDLSDSTGSERGSPTPIIKREVSFATADLGNEPLSIPELTTVKSVHDADGAASGSHVDENIVGNAAAGLQAVLQQKVLLPDIYSTRDQQEMKKQEMKQRATFRRLFMDIERQQVKDFSRLREHHERIESIRRAKEEERQRQEKLALKEWSRTYMSRDRCHAVRAEGRYPALEEQLRLQEQAQRARKAMESKRYLAALRQTLREKADRLGLQLPSLCLCSSSPWDTHPDACANNCIFYKNPRGYATALQNLVSSSCEVA